MWATDDTRQTFAWTPQPKAAGLVARLVQELLEDSPDLKKFARRLRDETGTRLVDWIDHLRLPHDSALTEDLIESDFIGKYGRRGEVFSHAGGLFPRIVVGDGSSRVVALKVDRLEEVMAAGWDGAGPIAGGETAALRSVRLFQENQVALEAWERHGATGFAPQEAAEPPREVLARHRAAFADRRREFATNAEGFSHVRKLIEATIADLGQDRACDLFFSEERNYWMRRNRAAAIQKARQDALGLGWGNHDHHTYRSSRTDFAPLVELLELLGFHCRERFYAGEEAGWGAQVLEQPRAGVVIFADVDLSPDEVAQDFAHEPLPPRDALGTVGLWCALHGEAFLQAGMHHLECQFDFDAAREQLAEQGIASMKPFTDFPFLRQCFTEGEKWQVDPSRVARLQQRGQISDAEAEKFLREGALGSHLEILERNDGYKGFNQTGISDIIQKTDPRGEGRG